MDNETPKYADWMPEAGGYVSNGKVVSKSPIYDEQGKLKLYVDPAVFGNTQPQNSSILQAVTQPTQQITNPLVTANTIGSNQDANAAVTGIGSMGSIENNTATTDSVLSSPALRSPQVKQPILSIEDQYNKDYQDAAARNDYQGMINALVGLSNTNGTDYTAQIQELTKQRQNKIESIDNSYSEQIANAMMLGDATTANALRQEQADWRASVGWADAMQQKYQTKQEQLIEDYHTTYMDGINDIAGMITQALPGILNFQYDPTTDAALNIAQGYAIGKVKEQMNATGMYYSSMTQRAITKAAAELVPVYQKMAKEEAIQNFQLLQNTANFLMDLEQTQFNLWKGQLDAKIAQNNERRKDVQEAWDRANQLGYVDNEAAAILGIPAGTESAATRKAMIDKLNKIDEENRKFDQDIALSGYTHTLKMQEMELQSQLDREENKEKAYTDYIYDKQLLQEKSRIDAVTPKKGTYNVKELVEYYNDLAKSGATPEEIGSALSGAAESQEALDQAIRKINNGDTAEESDRSIDQEQTDLNEKMAKSKPSEVLAEAIRYAKGDATTLEKVLNAVKYPKKDNLLDGEAVFDVNALGRMGVEAYSSYIDYVSSKEGDTKEVVKGASKLMTDLTNKKKAGLITDDEYNEALLQMNTEFVQDVIDTAAKKYGTDNGKTRKAVDGVRAVLDSYSEAVAKSDASNKNAIISDAYIELLTSIADTKGENGEETFDYNWLWGNTGDKSKIEAFANIASSIRDNSLYGENTSQRQVYDTVIDFLDALLGGESKEIMKSAWFAGY